MEDSELQELLQMWDHLRALEDFAKHKFKVTSSAQSTMGRIKRELADCIAEAVARDRVRSA